MNRFDAFVVALANFLDVPGVAAVYDRVLDAPSRNYVDEVPDRGPAAMALEVVTWARKGPKPEWFRNIDL